MNQQTGWNQQSGWRLFQRQIGGVLAPLALCAAMLLTACGGGSGGMSGAPTSGQTGAAMITVTDDPGDFLSYAVTVDSLQLTRSDGTVVETVPNTTQVDFAQLVDLAEIISAEQIPAGEYTQVTLTLNYVAPTAANIVVDNGTASGLAITNILNASGATLGEPVTMTLQLPSGSPLLITPGTVANLALDFNLAATNALVTYPGLNPVVDTSPATPPAVYIGSIAEGSAIAVEVSPALAASLVPDVTRQIRVRGPLATVNTSAYSYTIDVRPFFNASGSQGTFTVNTSPSTTFTINGTAYNTQAAGIAALNALVNTTPPTLTVAYGTFDTSTGLFTASEVLAGSSVAGGKLDSVEGTVIARTVSGSSDTLTVSRGRICRAGLAGFLPSFNRTVTVDIGPTTAVTEAGSTGSYTIADISVGQHLQAFGKYSSSSSGPTLDATVTGGSAQLMVTDLWGLYASSAANGGAGNVVTLNLQSLDGLSPSVFNFAGTGVSSAQDATASAYTVGVPAALSLPAWTAGAPARFAGFVSPFGTADGVSVPIVPDFSAITLVSYANTNAVLQLGWMPPGATAPFAGLMSTSTSLTLTQSTLQGAAWYHFSLGPERIAAAALSSGLTLTADSSAAMTQFGIVHVSSRTIDTFASFDALISALYGDLNPGMGMAPTVLGVFAAGPYDPTTFDLSVDRVAIALSD